MAWRSSGSTNDEMVDNLKRFRVISSPAVERGFRSVDRRFFVPQERDAIAHADQPLKEGNVHISAPHIYGSAIEALELRENSPLSFLNVGSGTGYMSCIVASILGPYSVNYGVEIHRDVVDHFEASVARWKANNDAKLPHMVNVHGNALCISPTEGEALVGFDRIYIGAALEPHELPPLRALLKAGGILVGPVGDELVKILRIKRSSTEGTRNEDFSQQVITGVRFASLLMVPNATVVLPSRVWSPAVHHSYPDSFRTASREILLCSHASFEQPIPVKEIPKVKINLAAMLPRVIWLEILSYTHHNWFEPLQSEDAFLRKRLLEEEEKTRQAIQEKREAEARCHIAERERDVYRFLARRLQSRLQLLMQQSDEEVRINEETNLLHGRESAAIFGLGAMLRGFQSDSDFEDEGNEMETEEIEQAAQQEGDDFLDELLDESDDDEHHGYLGNDHSVPDLEESVTSVNGSVSLSGSSLIEFVERSQARTVSISEDF